MERHPLYILVLLILLSGCKEKQYALTRTELGMVTIHDSLDLEDDAIEDMIEPYKEQLEDKMNKVIGYSSRAMGKPKEIMKAGNAESELGNLMADLLLFQTQQRAKSAGEPVPTICILNMGGIRTSLPKGAITVGNIYEIMPFDNVVKVQRLNATQMEKMFNYLAREGGQPISGFTMGIKNGKPIDIQIGEFPFDPAKDQEYHVVTSDYLANGGDRMEFFKNSTNTGDYGLLRDMIIEHFEYLSEEDMEADAQMDGRIYYDK